MSLQPGVKKGVWVIIVNLTVKNMATEHPRKEGQSLISY